MRNDGVSRSLNLRLKWHYAQSADDISKLKQADLDKSPYYQAQLAQTDTSLPLEARQKAARQAVSDAVENEVTNRTTLLTGAIGALTGGGALGEIARSRARKSILQRLLYGPGREALQEGLQSPEEQFIPVRTAAL